MTEKSKTAKFFGKLIKIAVLLALCFAVAVWMKGAFKKKPEVRQIPPRPVKTAIAVQKDALIYLEGFGNLYPTYNVDIQSQVTGQIKEVKFTEGKEVSKGDILFIIDPSQYKAQLDKAEAALISDMVDSKLKEDTFSRNKSLFDKQLISQQDFDTYRADRDVADAKVKLDRAQMELAKINLDYCYIRSPINGLAGKRLVDLGNIVTANNGPVLVNIKTIDSLYVDFTISETQLPRVRTAMKQGKLKVEISAEGDSGGPYPGELEVLHNTVDNTTGTILLRAIAQNKTRALWAGQFVRVKFILGVNKDAVLVPYEAVQMGQKGSYMFVITPENKAELRMVASGSRQGDYIVIEQGIAAAEKVVTEGHLGLSPGAAVIDVAQAKAESK